MAATRSLNTSKKKKAAQPFYETSSSRTSAKIIEEARRSVRGALPTNRPYTPADSGRVLFGSKHSISRPPSAYSIGAQHFSDERLSRPPTGQRLAPIEQSALEEKSFKISSRTKVYPTPPTPVQSFHDLSEPISYNTTEHTLDSPSKSSIASTDSTTELKQSQCSPKQSKRSLSANRRVLSGGSSRSPNASRVPSAGEQRLHTPEPSDKPTTVDSGTPTKSSSRRGSAANIEMPVWDSEIMPLLKKLDATGYDSTSELCDTCDLLWDCLSKHSLLGRAGGVGGTKRRGMILRTVFRLLDHKNPHLLLKVSKIILAMKVTSKNLLNVCKLLFAIAKSDKNDEIFKKEQISKFLVELLSTAEPQSDSEALVYGIGTVKLLASNSSLRKELGDSAVMELLAHTLHCSTECSQNLNKKLMRNILIQLTGALRNLSDSMDLREKLFSNSIIPHLVKVISDHITDSEIVFNISRLFSKLTLQSEFQVAVMQCLPLLLEILTIHSTQSEIAVRVCFILGNLVADDADAREMVFFKHSSLPVLNSLFSQYLSPLLQEVDELAGQSGPKTVRNTKHDVLIKLVRLVANLSVHPDVGPAIAQDKDTVDHLLCVLGLVSMTEQEELILNTLATLNNLTYYASQESSIAQRQTELAELLLKVVLVDNTDGLLECTRVYGNLSRHAGVRKVLTDNKVDEMMVTLLDSDRREIVYCACGVLVNMMTESQHRDTLAQNGGIRKLVEVLNDFGGSDWQLAALVCKILWNYSETLSTNSLCFGEEETGQLVQLLEGFSDNSFALSFPENTDMAGKELLSMAWQEEFLPLSNALLNRIRAHFTPLEPLSVDEYHQT